MATKTAKQKPKRRRVNFSLKAAEARSVSLVGDFNDWDDKAHPMKAGEPGVWKKSVLLTPGRYEYRFMVDGEWRNDPDNPEACPNQFGSHNNVRVVS